MTEHKNYPLSKLISPKYGTGGRYSAAMPLIDSKSRGIAPQLPLVEQGKEGREGGRERGKPMTFRGMTTVPRRRRLKGGREGAGPKKEDEAVDLQT